MRSDNYRKRENKLPLRHVEHKEKTTQIIQIRWILKIKHYL